MPLAKKQNSISTSTGSSSAWCFPNIEQNQIWNQRVYNQNSTFSGGFLLSSAYFWMSKWSQLGPNSGELNSLEAVNAHHLLKISSVLPQAEDIKLVTPRI